MKRHSIAFIAICFLFSGCSFPTMEIGKEQGKEGAETIRLFKGDTSAWVDTANPNVKRLLNGRYFHYHTMEDSIKTRFIIHSEDSYGTIVSGHINDWVFDSVFILADRKPLDSIFGPSQTLPCPFDSTITYRGRPKDTFMNLNDKWRVINESSYRDYWILNQNTSDVYGPMSFEQYLAKKKELGVPDRLRLKYEKDKVKK